MVSSYDKSQLLKVLLAINPMAFLSYSIAKIIILSHFYCIPLQTLLYFKKSFAAGTGRCRQQSLPLPSFANIYIGNGLFSFGNNPHAVLVAAFSVQYSSLLKSSATQFDILRERRE